MPPKLNDGGFVPYELLFADGRPVTIGTAELPPEPGWEPPDFGLHGYSADVPLSRAQTKRLIKAFNAAVNGHNRTIRYAKRRREKERRRMMKEEKQCTL
jgi:hypothetical protein